MGNSRPGRLPLISSSRHEKGIVQFEAADSKAPREPRAGRNRPGFLISF
jgi:hypothetical protein